MSSSDIVSLSHISRYFGYPPKSATSTKLIQSFGQTSDTHTDDILNDTQIFTLFPIPSMLAPLPAPPPSATTT